MAAFYPNKRRRTATGVLAGDFDPRPHRDVLTSLLNGVPKYAEVENDEEARRAKRLEREREKQRREKEREKERKRATSSAKPPKDKGPVAAIASTSASAISAPPVPAKKPIAQPRPLTAAPFWQARPNIHIPSVQRSVSVTPPPAPSSPPTTPDPSMSSATSSTSSKRPYTPYDGESVTDRGRSIDSATPPPTRPSQPRKKRIACRKGWKGWVEGSPPPSEKLINLDVVNVLTERKTRSGKSFDAIGVGKDGWV